MGSFVAPNSGGLAGPTFLLFGEGGSATVPEPAALSLLCCGIAALVARKWKESDLGAVFLKCGRRGGADAPALF